MAAVAASPDSAEFAKATVSDTATFALFAKLSEPDATALELLELTLAISLFCAPNDKFDSKGVTEALLDNGVSKNGAIRIYSSLKSLRNIAAAWKKENEDRAVLAAAEKKLIAGQQAKEDADTAAAKAADDVFASMLSGSDSSSDNDGSASDDYSDNSSTM